jgi:hypothetical protein
MGRGFVTRGDDASRGYGLCVAYCEANDCDAFPDSQACDRLYDDYSKITGAESFPCDEVPNDG